MYNTYIYIHYKYQYLYFKYIPLELFFDCFTKLNTRFLYVFNV